MSSRRRWSPVAVLAAALAFAITHGSRAIANLRVVHWEDRAFFTHVASEIHSLVDCFGKPGPWPGLYRPISTNLYYFALSALAGSGVAVPHVLNVVFVLANGLLLYSVCLDLMEPAFAALAAVIAVSRLALAELVLHTCEMQALSYVFFGLLAVKAWLRARRTGSLGAAVASGALLFVAIFSKEAAFSFLLVLVAWCRLGAGRSRGDALGSLGFPIAFTVAAGAILVLFGWPLSAEPTGFRYDLSPGNLLGNLTAPMLAFANPLVNLRASMAMPPLVIRLAGMWPVRAVVLALVGAELAVLARPRLIAGETTRILALGFALFLAGVLPFVAFEGRLYMRYAYLGHAGLAICGVALLRGLLRRAHPAAGGAVPLPSEQG